MNRLRTIVGFLLAALLSAAATSVRADDVAEVDRLVKEGRSGEAMARLDAALTAKPKDPQLRFLKGVMLADSGRRADAIAVFVLLNQDYPELPEPYNNLAVLYAGQGHYDKALAALEAAVRGNPGYATAWENLGDVHAGLAAQAYSRALTLDATNAALPAKIARLRTLFTATPPRRDAEPASP
jgi:Flp pilus assembly protein TadD